MRFVRRLTVSFAVIAPLVLGGCESSLAPLSVALGRYEAVRYAGEPLADSRICGVLTVASSTLLLESGARATYSVHYQLAGQPDQVFSGTGTATESDGYVRVRVRGVWSNALEWGARTELFLFQVVGEELHRPQGMDCDAPWAVEYTRQSSASLAHAR